MIFRHLRRYRSFTILNVLGLSVGLAACAFSLLFVRHELSYDRFHDDADRIFRIATEIERDGRVEGGAYVHSPVALELGGFPEIEALTEVQSAGRHIARRDGDSFFVEGIATADEHVFDVFDFGLLQGDPATVLVEPFSLVVTHELARQLFGEEDVVGRSIRLGESDFTVTGILAPVPSNSHWKFEGLISRAARVSDPMYERLLRSWFTVSTVYVKLTDAGAAPVFERKLADLMARVRPENSQPTYRLFLQPLADIHLHSKLNAELGPGGEPGVVTVFGAVGLLILLIACFNYINLATARSAKRAREIGIRKVAGASRGQLIRQLIGESVVTTLCAAVVAIVMLEFAAPIFGGLVGLPGDLAFLDVPWMPLGIIALAVVVGVLAGWYPAFLLSSAKPITVIRGRPMAARHGGIRHALVVVQFVVSMAFIAVTWVVHNQLAYIERKDIGFDREHIISIGQGDDVQAFRANYPAIKAELTRLADVTAVTASMGQPGIWAPENTLETEEAADEEQGGSIAYSWLATDFGFLDTFGIELLAGRDLDSARSLDSTDAILVNETAARALGFEDPIGHRLQLSLNNKSGTIVGVVRDFHHESLRESIKPTLMYATEFYFYSNVYVRFTGEDVTRTIEAIEATWDSFFPDSPFEYAFYDDEFDAQYVEDRRVARTADLVSLLAIFVASLGLFGLAAFASEQRAREISVRKVLGASLTSVVSLFSREYVRLIVGAFVIATPIAWFAADAWLSGFAYRVNPGVEVFAGAALITTVIAVAAVAWPAIRAATSDPAAVLRVD